MTARWLICRSAAPRWAPFAVGIFALAISGCRASYVDRGAARYAEHDYIEAEQIFAHNEARLRDASNAESARYGLYRASTFLALGDAAHAHEWLVNASRIARADADALSFEERRSLAAAWHAHATLVSREAPPAQPLSPPLVAAAAR